MVAQLKPGMVGAALAAQAEGAQHRWQGASRAHGEAHEKGLNAEAPSPNRSQPVIEVNYRKIKILRFYIVYRILINREPNAAPNVIIANNVTLQP